MWPCIVKSIWKGFWVWWKRFSTQMNPSNPPRMRRDAALVPIGIYAIKAFEFIITSGNKCYCS